MKSFTPEISWHNRDPVLSLDIQNKINVSSDNFEFYRIVTSGNDSHVIIWKALVDGGYKKGCDVDCLADLTRHQRPVNCVRFAPNEDLLAAGDDDAVIIIWKLTSSDSEGKMVVDENKEEINESPREVECKPGTSSSFEEEVIAKELWTPYKIFRGHIDDVSDLSWSPSGEFLLSASVDNTAIMWNVEKKQRIHTFNEHKNFVQGVTWDPLNQYIATLSSDRNLRIYGVNSKRIAFRVYKTVLEGSKSSRLFYDDTLRSFCRRLTFTPGGEFLIAPSGILELNGEEKEDISFINTTYVFSRTNINKPAIYLPSTKYTVAVRCCPQLFELRPEVENPFEFGYRIVFAVATQDSVLLYDSQQDLPFGYISQIHYTRLSDVSWSPDGRLLLISSTDGFCTFVTFEKDEIGIPYNGPKHDYFKKLETSPIVETPKEAAPESDKTKRTVNSTPSIKAFFKLRNSNLSPVVEVNEEKVAANSSDNVSESKGEVMEVDLTQEDSKDIETTPKRPKCDSVASKRSPLKSVNEAVSASILTAPPISQIKENSVVNLVNQFDSCLSPSSLSIASLISNEEHQKNSKKIGNNDGGDSPDLPNKKIKLSSPTKSNSEATVKWKANETSKQPRRVQLITLSLPKN